MHERNLEDHFVSPDISIFRYLYCGLRVGGKYWLFYNLISNSVWAFFAAERWKKESDVSGK